MRSHVNHRLPMLLLFVLSVHTGCTSGDSPKDHRVLQSSGGNEQSSVSKPDDDKLLNAAKSETWVATLDHGHAPGNGYEVKVSNQQIIDGKFYLLDPNKPRDLASAGQVAPFENVTASARVATFSITLQSGDGTYHDKLTITLHAGLSGEVGDKVRATVKSHQPETAAQELLFVRRE